VFLFVEFKGHFLICFLIWKNHFETFVILSLLWGKAPWGVEHQWRLGLEFVVWNKWKKKKNHQGRGPTCRREFFLSFGLCLFVFILFYFLLFFTFLVEVNSMCLVAKEKRGWPKGSGGGVLKNHHCVLKNFAFFLDLKSSAHFEGLKCLQLGSKPSVQLEPFVFFPKPSGHVHLIWKWIVIWW
jgi:hypothetical protein